MNPNWKNAKTALVIGMIGALPIAAGAQINSYSAVTDARLQNPERENWLMYRGNYAGWGYSPLDKINTGNVARLVPAWTFGTGVAEGHQSPPMVNNGIMFVSTPQNQVIALDARNGDVLWQYKKALPEDLLQLHPTNRGVALYEDKVYLATVDAHLVALDARTGKVIWDKVVDDYKKGYYCTLAPLVTNGKVMVGTSGGELAIRGFIQAFDARSGDTLWRTYTIPDRAAGVGDVARRRLEDRRRVGVDPRHLRSEAEPGVLGRRQRGSLGRRLPPGRQSLHDLRYRGRPEHRCDQGASPVPLERLVGLGRGDPAHAHRREPGRPHDQGSGTPWSQRLSVATRAQRRQDLVCLGQALRDAECLQEHRPGNGPAGVCGRAHATQRRADRFLPVALGWQGLAPGCVQEIRTPSSSTSRPTTITAAA